MVLALYAIFKDELLKVTFWCDSKSLHGCYFYFDLYSYSYCYSWGLQFNLSTSLLESFAADVFVVHYAQNVEV